MRKLMIAAACTALLAACSQEPDAAPTTTTAATPAEATTTDAELATPVTCPEVASPLPEGLVIEVPVHLAADRITKTANDQMRRVTTLDYLEGTQDDVLAQVRESLTAAGFTEKADPNEREIPVYIFQKKGVGGVHVAFPVLPADGASHPSAQGRMVVNAPYVLASDAG